MPSTLIFKLHRIVEILFFGQLYSFFCEIKSDQKVSREAFKKTRESFVRNENEGTELECNKHTTEVTVK